jgi:hypothetical protein
MLGFLPMYKVPRMLLSCSLEVVGLALVLVLLTWELEAAVKACHGSSVNKLVVGSSDLDMEVACGVGVVEADSFSLFGSQFGGGWKDWKGDE